MKEVIKVVDILLPKKSVDYSKWSVVACDQYTSEPEYWEEIKQYIGDNYSTLNIIFPEVYLGDNDGARISKINSTMQSYIEKDIFDVVKDSFVFVDRTLADNRHRLGLVMAIDLEEYDYSPTSKASIKATEGTVIERIPPRLKIRQNATLELPHIMLLMDDRKREIIEGISLNRDKLEKLYDFDLCGNGGHIEGYRVADTKAVIDKIYGLLDKELQMKMYHTTTDTLFMVGDGNHSLATAKAHWDKVKSTLTDEERKTNLHRFALVELVNLHDDGLLFEPIHRVVFNVTEDIVKAMIDTFSEGDEVAEMRFNGTKYELKVPNNAPNAIEKIQNYIDNLIKTNNDIKVDYVHGRANTLSVADREKGLAILMPTIKKEELFGYIIEKGVLPRKSFSMGEANDKRYYLEAKLLPNKEIK